MSRNLLLPHHPHTIGDNSNTNIKTLNGVDTKTPNGEITSGKIMIGVVFQLAAGAKSTLFLSVVWWINLCGGSWMVLSGQELMNMTGVGISFASPTKLRTHMLIG